MTVAAALQHTESSSSSSGINEVNGSHGIDEENQLERDLGVESDITRLRDQAILESDDEDDVGDRDLEDDDTDDPASKAQSQDSLYYDASTMASLNPISVAAINRLRAYKPPPFPLWETLPARRRAAVLILLFADRAGDLRVVVTMRAASLRSFSGHAALPGGKADSVDETPYQIARREAFEEIGLPMDDGRIPKPFRIEPLCILPPSLARTHLVVTPCVAFLHADRTLAHASTSSSSSSSSDASASASASVADNDNDGEAPLVEESMIPRLDAREVAAVFSAPFYNFLKVDDLPPPPGGQPLPPGRWYDGAWIAFKDMPWRVHNFYVPVNNQRVSKPRRRSSASAHGSLADALDQQQEFEGRFKVWGMTGRVLVDAARIAYAEEPEMEHNDTFGDYDIIQRAFEEGSLENPPAKEKPDAGKESHKM